MFRSLKFLIYLRFGACDLLFYFQIHAANFYFISALLAYATERSARCLLTAPDGYRGP